MHSCRPTSRCSGRAVRRPSLDGSRWTGACCRMSNPRLKDMLMLAGRRMALDLRERLIPHRGELGASREESIREFLRAYLPKRFEVSSGFVFDANGLVSEQIDIIVADAFVAPRFEAPGGVRFYPCEAVVAAGEVKTSVTSRRELWDAISQLRSVTNLDRTANGRSICYHTGEPIDHTQNHLHRIFTFLLIIDRAPSASLTREVLLEVVHRSPPHLWPNIIVALEKYLITYHCDDGVCPNTEHARAIATVDGDDFAETLLRFYLFLSQAIAVTSVAQASSWAYLGGMFSFGSDLIYAATNDEGEPPPYLSTLEMFPWEFPFDDLTEDEGEE